MGWIWRQGRGQERQCAHRCFKCIGVLSIFAVSSILAMGNAWAVQRHELAPGGHGASEGSVLNVQGSHVPPDSQGGPIPSPTPHQAPAPGFQNVPTPSTPQITPDTHGQTAAPGHEEKLPGQMPSGAVHGPGGEGAPHGAHGPSLPQISPIPGVTFVQTMIDLMDHELNGRFLGWRPNDLIVGRFTDDVNNFQLGVLETLRFTTLRLKDSLTRMGDADAYDSDLEQALNLFMNKSTQFWFPSAESSYNEAVQHLKRFRGKLEAGQRSFYYRIDNLVSLINVYKDFLGNVNRSLIMASHMDGSPVSWFETDDYYYYAKGVAHVMYEILRVVRVGYKDQLTTINAADIMDEILHELHRAEEMDPWIILDSNMDSLLANHRANLNAPLSEVTHLLGVVSGFR